MNYGCYQPGMVGMMPTFPGQPIGPTMPGVMPEQMPTMPGTQPLPTEATAYDQMNHRLTRLEQQVRRLEARVARLETPFPESQTPYQGPQGFEMPESTYSSNMHMV